MSEPYITITGKVTRMLVGFTVWIVIDTTTNTVLPDAYDDFEDALKELDAHRTDADPNRFQLKKLHRWTNVAV